jgi:hypothetical protein
MAVISTATTPKLLWPGIKALWGDAFYNQHEEEYSKIFDIDTSKQHYEEYQGLTGFGLAPTKTQGSPLVYDTEQQGYNKRFTHITYGLGFQVTMEEIDDNLYAKAAGARAKNLARSMRHTIETVAANHLNRADDSSYTGADGKELIATDHPNVNGGTWQNEPTNATDLSEVAIEDLVILMMKATDDRGLKMALRPRCLMVHPNDWFNAHRIVGSTLQNDSANNAVNVIRSQGIFPDGIVVNHWFDDTDQWFIKSDCPQGLKFVWRKEPSFQEDNDFSTKNALHSGIMRFSSGWVDPRGVYGSPGA